LTELVKKLVSLDKDWVPSDPGHSLYIRPTMIGTQAGLGVGASEDVLLFVILSPVGPYYRTGFKPVKLLASTKDVRAWPGGTGGHKLGANYAGGVLPAIEAAEKGYQQILWLFGPERMLTEVGTMNVFAVFERPDGGQYGMKDWIFLFGRLNLIVFDTGLELATPALGDTTLPGVTRDSILQLARSGALTGLPKDLLVSERKITMGEVEQAAKEGRLREMFGAGTAAVVAPVESVGVDGRVVDVPVGSDGLGDVARAALREISRRQLGEVESEWSVAVD
jgi:branched-chain amino acid aminotransferase